VLAGLIQLVSSPKATADALKRIEERKAELTELQGQADEAKAALQAGLDDLAEKAKALDERARGLDEREKACADAEKEIARQRLVLEAQEGAIQAEKEDRAVRVKAERMERSEAKAEMAKEREALDAMAADLAKRAGDVAATESAIETTVQEAEAIKAVWEAKMAGLKSLMAE
jgi:chromosome segregation ATPase